MTSVVRRPLIWVLRYAVPAALIASWLTAIGYGAHWDMPVRRCNAPTGYCGKSGAPKTEADYNNSNTMDLITVGLWAAVGLGIGLSWLAAERIRSIPSAKEIAAPDLRS